MRVEEEVDIEVRHQPKLEDCYQSNGDEDAQKDNVMDESYRSAQTKVAGGLSESLADILLQGKCIFDQHSTPCFFVQMLMMMVWTP